VAASGEDRIVSLCLRFFIVAVIATMAAVVRAQTAPPVRVLVQTDLGEIVLELDPARAPGTTASFLKYVDAGHYDGGRFRRTVKLDTSRKAKSRSR
jgi:peptidyl-prolyl cis-trans isomerase A (cyclophilin A)